MSRFILVGLAVAFTLALVACGGGNRIDPILQLSTAEALARGKEYFESEKFARAERYLEHAFEASPNSREGREALLLSADALFHQKGTDAAIRCEAKYRDFLNRFPTSARSDYAQYQIGNCLAKRVEKPDRDQQVSRQAIDAFEELFRLYPTSTLTESAREKIATVTNTLAESEFMVGFFYTRYRLCKAAIDRLKPIEKEFPNYGQHDRTLFFLGRAHTMCGEKDEAEAVFGRLRAEHPSSEYIGQIEKATREAEKLIERSEKRRRKGEKKLKKRRG